MQFTVIILFCVLAPYLVSHPNPQLWAHGNKPFNFSLQYTTQALHVHSNGLQCPTCSTEAGCPRPVCPCLCGKQRYDPPPYSLASTKPGCPDCPKGTNCIAYHVRIACSPLKQCTRKQVRTWLPGPLWGGEWSANLQTWIYSCKRSLYNIFRMHKFFVVNWAVYLENYLVRQIFFPLKIN